MAVEMALVKPISKFSSIIPRTGNYRLPCTRFFTIKMLPTVQSRAATVSKKKKAGKQEINETLLTPRFYTTDFDEMELLFNTEINKNLNMAEFEALLQEFKTDFSQPPFVRNKEFEAADKMEGPLSQIFVEYFERSCIFLWVPSLQGAWEKAQEN